MSRTIKDSITALETSLDSCKTSLEGKNVTVETRPKVSELPELIDSIEAGSGSEGFNWIKDCTDGWSSVNGSRISSSFSPDGEDASVVYEFTLKEEASILLRTTSSSIQGNPSLVNFPSGPFPADTKVTIKGTLRSGDTMLIVVGKYDSDSGIISNPDVIFQEHA